MTPSWRPILEGELAERALASAREVSEALCLIEPQGAMEVFDAALFWAYAAGAFDDEPRFDEQQELAMERVAVVLEEGQLGAQFYGGYAGVGWVLNHLSPTADADADADADVDVDGDDEEADEVGEMLDDAVAELVSISEWRGHYDLITGLVGLGVYMLDRLPRPRAKAGLECVIAHLAALSETLDGRTGWHTRPENLPAWQREHKPNGHYDLGVAHGVAGVIAFLAAVLEREPSTRQVPSLLEGAVRFLVETQTESRVSLYPSTIEKRGDAGGSARTAWCYGDPGIAISLLRAAKVLGDSALADRALSLARASAARPVDDCAIVDAGLCHGRAGLAHVLNRLSQATGDAALAAAACQWFERTLNERREGGIGGYPALSPKDEVWNPSPTILEGAAGVSLALISAATDIEPGWDRMLLVDLPLGTSL